MTEEIDWMKHLMAEIHELNVNVIQLGKELNAYFGIISRFSGRVERLEKYFRDGRRFQWPEEKKSVFYEQQMMKEAARELPVEERP